MNNQTQNNYARTETSGGKFCSRCGHPLDASRVCHNLNCPTNLGSNQSAVPHKLVNPQYQQSYNQNSVSQQPAAPTIFTFAWDYVKVFFSSNPLSTVENIGKTAENIWIVLGGAAAILISLGLFGIGSQKIYEVNVATLLMGINYWVSNNSVSTHNMFTSNDVLWLNDGFKLFVFLLLTVLIQFFAVAGINNILFYVHKQTANYLRSLNILSASVLPLALSGGVAFVASYISIIVAGSVILVGLIISFILMYYGMQKAGDFKKSPLWGFTAVIFADMVSLFIIVTVLGKIFA